MKKSQNNRRDWDEIFDTIGVIISVIGIFLFMGVMLWAGFFAGIPM